MKKGFTLIELLAVIIILAIILLIAYPLISNVIDASKRKSFEVTVENIKRSAEMETLRRDLTNDDREVVYSFDDYEQSVIPSDLPILDFNGKPPLAGTVSVDSNGNVEISLTDGTYLVETGDDGKLKDAIAYDGSQTNPQLQTWIKSIGGTFDDDYAGVIQDQNRGYIAVGNFRSTDFDFEGMNKGITDGFIAKYDLLGNLEWKKGFGGTGYDNFNSVVEADTGYMVVGYSDSDDGDVAGTNQYINGLVVKYDLSGEVVWKKKIGGDGVDYDYVVFYSVTKASDGNYLATGTSETTTGDLNGQGTGNGDVVIVKFSENGSIIWTKVYAGSCWQDGLSIINTSDNGFAIAGYSCSDDFDLEGMNKGSDDAILVKYDSSGSILWKRNFGGTDWDGFYSLTEASDGGLVAVGSSASTDVDLLSMNKGSSDAIIVKYNSTGNIVWKKSFGGTASDRFNSVVTVANEGFVTMGKSCSIDNDLESLNIAANCIAITVKYDLNGDVLWKKGFGGIDDSTGNFITNTADGGFIGTVKSQSKTGNLNELTVRGANDGILIKYDSFGEYGYVEPSKFVLNFGGASDDRYLKVTEDGDGNLYTVGNSTSDTGDLLGLNYGNNDAIITKYDKTGSILWKKNFGGSNSDAFLSVKVVTDGIIVVGHSYSIDEDLSGFNKGGMDGIIIKYDEFGNIIWKKIFGGSLNDNFCGVVEDTSGNLFVVGESYSINDDMTGLNKGSSDAILIKYSSTGDILWKKTFGGTGPEGFFDIAIENGNLIIVGSSSSSNGDMAGLNMGDNDALIVKFDSNGDVLWKRTFGGTDYDEFYSLIVTDNRYAVVGVSMSNNFNMAGLARGHYDGILVLYDFAGTRRDRQSFGGSLADQFTSIIMLKSGEYLITGSSYSTDNQMLGKNYGGKETFLVKYSSTYGYRSIVNYGGSNDDILNNIILTKDGSYAAVGESRSNDYNFLNQNKGMYDAILYKFNYLGKFE